MSVLISSFSFAHVAVVRLNGKHVQVPDWWGNRNLVNLYWVVYKNMRHMITYTHNKLYRRQPCEKYSSLQKEKQQSLTSARVGLPSFVKTDNLVCFLCVPTLSKWFASKTQSKSSKLIKCVRSSVFLSNLFCVSHFSAVSFFSSHPSFIFLLSLLLFKLVGWADGTEKLTRVCLKKVRQNERGGVTDC